MTQLGSGTRRAFCSLLTQWFLCSVGVATAGCHAIAAKTPAHKPTAPSQLSQPEQLRSLATSAGLRWIVLTRPQDFLRHPIHGKRIARFVPRDRLSMFRMVTGIDIEAIEQLVVAGYRQSGDQSVLFLMNGTDDPIATESAFRDRFVRNSTRMAYRPDAIWSHGKNAAGEVRAIAVMPSGVIAVEGGDSFRSKVALFYAMGRLKRTSRAFDLLDMGAVDRELGDGVVRAFAPGPFEGEWKNALGGVLGGASVVGAGIQFGNAETMELSVRLAGAWGSEAPRALAALLSAWMRLAESPLGRVLGCDEPSGKLFERERPDMVGFNVRMDGARLLDGLFGVVAADLADILRLDDHSP